MIKLNRGRKMITALAVVMAAVMLLSGTTALASSAPSPGEEGYEPLEVTLPYRHVYTTTDTAADSVFHYIIEATAGEGTLPAEADSAGGFSFEGKTGSGTTSGDDTVYDASGALTFTFTKPGEYTYHIKPDAAQDSQKENADRYSFESREYDVRFFIANETDGSMRLRLLTKTVENQDDEKVNEVLMEIEYEWNPVIAPVTVPLNVKKIMTGPVPNGKTMAFSFAVTGTGAVDPGDNPITPIPGPGEDSITITVKGNGTGPVSNTGSFGEITFNQAGTYTYTIEETVPSARINGVTYGSDTPGSTSVTLSHTLVITVTNNSGQLETSCTLDNGAFDPGSRYVEFNNAYKPNPVEVPLGVKKIMTGSTLPDDAKYTFTFTLTAPNGTPMPATTEVSMTVRKNTPAADLLGFFGNIQYTAAGTYTYTVKETLGGKYPGVTCAQPEKTVTVMIKDNNGALELERITGVTKDGTVYRAEITNNYSPKGTPKIGDDTPVRLLSLALLGSGMTLAGLALTKIHRKRTGK